MARAFLLGLAEEERLQSLERVERRRLRDFWDPLQLPEEKFIANFRLNKAAFHQVYEDLCPYLPAPRRKTAVCNKLKILAVLNFFASGSDQKSVGGSYLYNMSQTTFSKSLHEVIDALNARKVLLKYINHPSSQREREMVMKDFMEKFGFPGIIGCIDGTHVALIQPTLREQAYCNQNDYHSLNVLVICDANLNIWHVDASFGGAADDCYVWNECPVKSMLEGLNTERCWLLGDSGYPQSPWMMTPILNAAPGTPEKHYTDLHCRVMSTVKRCIGALKARWQCLLAHRLLYYDPVTTGKIVNGCVVLHNIANAWNVPMPELQRDDVDSDQLLQVSSESATIEATPDTARDVLVERLCTVESP